VSNIVQFPLALGAAHRATAHVAARLLSEPPTHSHAVQFYDDEAFLFETVALFVGAGFDAGDSALIIATSAHMRGILERLGKSAREQALESGQLILIDAEAMLDRFMVADKLVESLCTEALDRVMAGLTATLRPHRTIRAFGEMVDLLWQRGKPAASIQLEELWCRIASQNGDLALLCSYGMRNFYKPEASPQFGEICRLHSHVLPTERFARDAGDGFDRLREISVLEQRARLLENEVQYREELESALRMTLVERARAQSELHSSIEREREARRAAVTSTALEDVLFRMIDPLHTLLTTSRLLAAPRPLSLDGEKLARLAATSARVQQALDEILEMTQDRFSYQVPVLARVDRDVAAIVTSVLDELRLAHPSARWQVLAPHPCFAPLDTARFRHVLLDLGRYSVHQSAPESPITVEVAELDAEVTVRFHHLGDPIAPELASSLALPSRRRPPPLSQRSDGSIANLYISQLIVSGHGGSIQVSSSVEEGTAFLVRLPRFPPAERRRAE
jgi:signal transduction histidine kinase